MPCKKVILETARTYLHELTADEATEMFDLNNDPLVIKYTGDPPFPNVEAAKVFLESYSDYTRNGFGRWAVRLKENDCFIGWCGLKRHENDEVDLGFRFKKSFWNQGFATETAFGCIDYATHNLALDYLIGRAMRENTASLKVLEKVGMKYWKDLEADLHQALCFKLDLKKPNIA
jgi:[ribosomal protein S5]-alanine N-acetyltransferase